MRKKITPMDSVTLRALRGSIKKWERIVASSHSKDYGTENCPLCLVFLQSKDFLTEYCVGCPVSAKTGREGCAGSPYVEWNRHQEDVHRNYGDHHRFRDCKECLRLAKAELASLRDLLPKPKRAVRKAVEK